MNIANSQEAVIKSVDGDTAQLSVAGQTIAWPTAKLPNELKPDDQVLVCVTTVEIEQMNRDQLAKAILNEILNTEHPE